MTVKIRIELSSLATTKLSGVSQYTRLLTDALARDNSSQVVGCYFNFLNRQPKPKTSLQKGQIKKNTLIPLRVYAKAQSFGFAPAFDLFQPKATLTIFPNFATWPTIKSKFTATVIHDLTYLYFPELVEEKNLAHLRRVVPRSIKKASFIITVSESVKAELVKEFNLNPDNCVVTPIPPDETFFSTIDTATIAKTKEKYSINPNKKYIYFIGNLEPRKNLKTLIEAYRLLPTEIKDQYSLVLAGGHGWKTESTKDALENAISSGEDIKHIGFIDQEDSPALYQGASLFVMPSLYEGFGMPVLEAMASGIPVVASDIPVLKEVGGSQTLYANPSMPEDFRDAIVQTLSKQKSSRAELQKNVTRYSWSKNVELIKDKLR